MRCFAVLGIQDAHSSGDHGTPITALCDILVVSELLHQLVACFSVLDDTEASLLHTIRETIVGNRRGYDMEGRSISATGVDAQERKEFADFEKAPRPCSVMLTIRTSRYQVTYIHDKTGGEWLGALCSSGAQSEYSTFRTHRLQSMFGIEEAG